MSTKRKHEVPDQQEPKRRHTEVPGQQDPVRKKVFDHIYGNKFWGPYLSERQWCTVREETLGNCWDSTAYEEITLDSYRWGEDGIFGLSDEQQQLCMGLSLWNGKDSVVKERFFGLTGPQGNHGEDVKELYFYLDNDPDHRYMKALYLYPQTEFPYTELIEQNKGRSPGQSEYEILDTGVFDDGHWQIMCFSFTCVFDDGHWQIMYFSGVFDDGHWPIMYFSGVFDEGHWPIMYFSGVFDDGHWQIMCFSGVFDDDHWQIMCFSFTSICIFQEFDVSELSTIRGLIVKKQETIDQLNEKIVEELSEEEVSEEIEEADRYTYDIEMSVTKLSKIIKESEITDKQSKWQPFWDSFSAAVHDNLSLNDVQKFNYLKSQLFGEATQCIAGLQITNTNYGQALHVLKQRFGQPHKIVQTYMQSLISLPSPTSNITHLKKFYDSMENYIRGLESIGESHESFGSLLVPIILNKLPGNIRENMVRAHGGDHWNLPSLRQAIQHEITIKEAGQSVNGDDIEPNYTPTSAFFT
ncbi:Hypothetical predicted protein, partial [Mytilus galloprovincialis]